MPSQQPPGDAGADDDEGKPSVNGARADQDAQGCKAKPVATAEDDIEKGSAGSGDPVKFSATVRADCLASPAPVDPAAAFVSRRARIFVFTMLCQVTQMFMSYDGGATPASLDTIQHQMNDSWTPAEFGLLGAMDKIAQASFSIIWGRVLQLCSVKLLLVVGLGLNAAASFSFGFVMDKNLMYLSKFIQGATESMRGVWGTVWTVSMAPPEFKTLWLGLGAVSAGLGNGIGTGVAGFGTGSGLPYAFAFEVQSAVLAALWLCQVLVPAGWLMMTLPRTADGDADAPSSAREVGDLAAAREVGDSAAAREVGDSAATREVGDLAAPREVSDLAAPAAPAAPTEASPALTTTTQRAPSTCSQLKEFWRNRVYLWTSLVIAISMFVMSGIQFLWVRVFVEVWGLGKNKVTMAFLIVTGIGGGIGLAIGPAYIDRRGGYSTSAGVLTSLRSLRLISILTGLSGAWGMICLYGKMRSRDAGYWQEWGDHWLWMCWVAISFIWALRNGAVPALCGINVEVVPPEMRTFSSGFQMTLRTILGDTLGPLLPGLFMNWIGQILNWDLSDARTPDWLLCSGLAFVLSANLLDFFLLSRATKAAAVVLASDQMQALEQLREALKDEDIHALEKAILYARSVELHTRKDGEAVLGMANEALGAFHALGRADFGGSFALTASRTELQQRVRALEEEIALLREENARLRAFAETKGLQRPALCDDAAEPPDQESQLLVMARPIHL